MTRVGQELDIQQQQQFALLRRRGVEPATAREIVLGELTPETKSGYPDPSGVNQAQIPRTFSSSNWPQGLTLEPIGALGAARRSSTGPSVYEVAGNSAVLASINTVAQGCVEAPIVVKRESEEQGGLLRLQVLRRHPIHKLLRRPNLCQPEDPDSKVFMGLRDMVWLREYCCHVDGNAYWQIIRLGDPLNGIPIMLIPIMPYMIEPVTVKKQDGTSTDYISYYAYVPSPYYANKPMRISCRNMLHFRYGRDPMDLRKGLGLVKHLLREVYRDDLATKHTNTLLRNGAVPGLVVSPEEGYIDADDAREAKARLQAAFSGDEMGSVAVMSAKASVKQFGFDPSQMNLAGFHKHAEERVAAVLNVPAMVAQLGAGLEQAAQFSNFHEAREMFAENTVLPRLLAANEVMTELMRDFTDDPRVHLVHDIDDVRALQGDLSEKVVRLQVGVGGGWVTANEARAQVGMPPIDATQKVPLTQGQDNRLNTLTQAGLITLNEARSTVGLSEVGYGDLPISQVQLPGGPDSLPALDPPGAPRPPQLTPGEPAGNVGDTGQTNQGVGNTQATKPPGLKVHVPAHQRHLPTIPTGGGGRQGANLGTKSRAGDLERLFETTDPDVLFHAWKELRDEGLNFVDIAFPRPAEPAADAA